MAGLSRLALVAAACVMAGVSVVSAQVAQSAADSRWDTFLGCWTAADPGLTAKSTPIVCVTPTNVSTAVQVATVRNDSIIGRDTIDASGARKTVSKQGCAGWQNAEWSEDTRRVYLHSELTCAGGLKRTGTGLFAIAPAGDWLDVQGMVAGGNEGLRVNHYRMTQTPAAVVAAFGANPVANRELSASSQRTAAGGIITVGNIGEVVFKTDTAVAQAWIVERGARFNLSAKELVALANAGIPGSVTDVMVGISYPDRFALQGQQVAMMGGANMLSPRDSARIAADYLNDRCGSTYDPLWDMPGSFNSCGYRPMGYGGGYGYGYGYGYDSLYGMGYSPYGLGYGGYYNGYGYPGGYYSSPIIVVKGDQAAQQQHGRVVNGRGYSQGTSSTPSTGGASNPSYSPSTTSGSSSSGSSTPVSSPTSSGTSSGTRT
ncbi:MAG: hypothetical protein ABI205_09825, partial [Gemmatimonadaceae bacterium]